MTDKAYPPLPEKSYLGDDASYGYDEHDMRDFADETAELRASRNAAGSGISDASYTKAQQDVWMALSEVPCDCSARRREEGTHLSGCHLFDVHAATDAICEAAATAEHASKRREQELSMAIRRIVSKARRHCEDESPVLKLANEAWSMLMRMGLQGSPMRDDAPTESGSALLAMAPATTQAQEAEPVARLLADKLDEMTQRKDAAYLERNQVVAALAHAYPSGIARTAIEGWSEDWHGCVYIDLPTGQASWHYHDSHAGLFAHLPPYAGSWDGHTTEQKYERLAALNAAPTQADSAPGDEAQVLADAEDSALLDWLRDNSCDLRCISVPTGGDDYDIHWAVIEHHMTAPHEREIGYAHEDDPAAAIRAARAAM